MNPQPCIDIHAHIYPDKIRERAVAAVGAYYGLHMCADGSPEDMLARVARAGIDVHVAHGVATVASQVRAINDYTAQMQARYAPRILGFGTLHCDMSAAQVRDELRRIRRLGLRGIKMHPDFQAFAIDSPAAQRIYAAIDADLPLMMHMGDRNSDASSPERLARVLDAFPRLQVIASHLGGYSAWAQAQHFLVGRDVYMDTSSALPFLPPPQAADLIRAHGVGRVFFGTDYPMWDTQQELARFLALPLSAGERAAVLYGNAAALLGINL